MNRQHYRVTASGSRYGRSGETYLFEFDAYLSAVEYTRLMNHKDMAANWVERNCPDCSEATGTFNLTPLYD